MKRLKYLVLALILILPINVKALVANVNLTCKDSKLTAGKSTTCTVSVPVTAGSLTAFSGKIVLSNNLELVSVASSSIWQGNGSGGKYDLYTDTPKTGTVAIGTFVVKVNTTATNETITLTNIVLGNESFEDNGKGEIKTNIKVPSTAAELASLSVDIGLLSPNSNTSITTYSINT